MKAIIYSRLIYFLLLFIFSPTAWATHIVGGEMTYRCLGNNQYEVSLTIFRDCDTGVPWFDNPASIGVFDNMGVLVQDIRVRLRTNDTLDLDLTDSCYVAPPNVCIHRTTYLDTITLPYRVGGYQLAYQRCCRNQDIVNIIDPLGTGATYTVVITEEALQACNSSPTFRDWPPVYLCIDVPIVFDHSATDVDGDSLVYELCAPFEGATTFNPQPQPPFSPAYDSVVWNTGGGYSTANMLGGTDALYIDPNTGLLTGTPTRFGVFVVGIRVKEYRNGVLISTMQRDFQYAIGQCGRRNNAAFFMPEIICDDALLVSFQNNSQTTIQSYLWDFGDPTTTLDQSTLASPAYIYPDSGLYTVRLIVAPNTICADTFYRAVNVQYESLLAGFSFSVPSCTNRATVSFANQSRDSLVNIVSWLWTFGDSTSSTLANPTHIYNQSGTYPIRLIATSVNGCKDTITGNFSIDLPVAALADTTWICPNQTSVRLNAGSLGGNYQYNWSPPTFLSATNIPNPIASPPPANAPMTYVVTATANNTNGVVCSYTNQTVVAYSPPFTVDIIADTITCAGSIALFAETSVSTSVAWSASPTDTVFSTDNPTILPLLNPNTTVYVTATNVAGCSIRDSLLITSSNFPVQVDFNYTVLDCANPTLVQVTDLTTDVSQGAITNWSLTVLQGSNIVMTSTDQNPLFSFTQSGTYLIRLNATTANQCSGSRQVFVSLIVPRITSPDSIGICAGQTNVTLNPNGDPTFIYQWSPATNLSSVNAVSPISNTPTTRTYYVTVTGVNGTTVCRHIDSVKVVVAPPLVVDVPNMSIYCNNTVTLTATPNRPVQSYQWAGDPSFFTIIATGNPVTITPNVFPVSGYYVRATDFYGCTATDFAMVQQITTPINVQFNYNVLSCSDTLRARFNDMTVDTLGSRIVSWHWTSSDGQSSTAQNPTFTYTQTGSYTIRLEVVLANGCIGSRTQFVNFNITRLASSSTAFICADASTVVLNAGGNPAFQYQWSPAIGLSSTTAASPTATPPSLPFVYQVTVTGQNGLDACVSTHAITVQQASPVGINLPPDTTVCTEPFLLTADTENAVLLEWSLNPNFNPVALYNANPVFISFGGIAGNTPIYARVSDANGCIAVDSTVITRVVDTVPVHFGYDYLGCSSTFEVQFTDSTQHAFPITSLLWDFGNGQTDYTQNPLVQYAQSGTYVVNLSMTDARGCMGVATDTLRFDLPILAMPDTVNICGGGVLNLNVGGNPNLQYLWSPNTNISSVTAVSPSVTVTENTTYTVTITANNNGEICSQVRQVAIGVGNFQLQVASDTAICSNNIGLIASSPTPATYYWAIDSQYNFLLGTGSPFLTNINRSRTFYVVAVDAYGCTAKDSVLVTILQEPMRPNFDISSLFCADSLGLQFFDRTDSLDQSPIYWQWHFGDGDSSNLQNPIHTYAQSGTYDVTLYLLAQSGCNASTTRPVSVQVVTAPALADTFDICLGNTVAINPNSNPADIYAWNTNQSGLSSYTVANPIATPTTATTYMARIRSINSLGNQTDTCFVDLSRTVLPTTLTVDLDDIELICSPDTEAQLTVIGGNMNTNYTWSPASLILQGQNTATATITLPTDTATISLFASDANGCTATASSFVNIINVLPPLDIFASRDTVLLGDTLQLIATNDPAYSYTWAQNPTLQGNTIYNPIVQPIAGTTTIYTLTVTDANGCINVDSIIVFAQNNICGEPYIFVPNVFTPDGDGLNDAFFVRGANLTDFYLAVYNRWGELIFETSDQSRGWDGTFKGKTLPPDVFGYYLRCKCDDGTPYFKKGNVTIIK